jgi:GH24 family phage-related lysozyme (muramidase)
VSISVRSNTPTHATALVRFTYGGGAQNGGNSVLLALVNEGGWKVADITNRHGVTLTGTLQMALTQYPGR